MSVAEFGTVWDDVGINIPQIVNEVGYLTASFLGFLTVKMGVLQREVQRLGCCAGPLVPDRL